MTPFSSTTITDRALFQADSARSGRAWAWVALCALAVMAVVVVLQAFSDLARLGLVLLAAAALLVVAPVVAWIALTTRSAWKRLACLAVGMAVTAALVAALVAFTLVQIGGLLVILVPALIFRAAVRRAVPGVSMPSVDATRPPDLAPPARPWMLVNPWSGGGTAAKVGLAAAAEAAGFDVHVLAPGDDPAELAHRAVADGADVLAVAGGDGTLALVAAVAVAHDRPFLCVPAGTRNHFARDLGLDRSDPLGALRGIRGHEVRVDAAFVGDRLFLNNVSLGAYADVVAKPRYRAHKMDTSRVVVRRLVRGEQQPLDIRVRYGAGRLSEGIQVLQVANNRYQLRSLRRLGSRERLDGGSLQVSALLTSKGSELAGLAARAAVGRLHTASVWAQWDTPTLIVDSALPLLAAGVDGESVFLPPPLEFRVEPGALRVLVPAHVGSWTAREAGPVWTGVPPWEQVRRRRQAVPGLWRLATASPVPGAARDRARTGRPATIAACPPPSGP